jgi:hypothetical protein
MYLCIRKRKCNHCAENIRRPRTKFSRSGDEEPGICAPTDLTFHAMSSYCSWKSWVLYHIAEIVFRKKEGQILISNFCIVLNVVFFLLGDSLARPNFMCRRFGTLFHLHRSCEQISCSHDLGRHIKFRHRGITQKKEYSNGRFNSGIIPFPVRCVYLLLYLK